MTLVTLTTAWRGVCSSPALLCGCQLQLITAVTLDNVNIILNTAATSYIPHADTADLVRVLRTQKTE